MNFARDCCCFSWLDAASEQSGGKASRSSDTLGCKYRLPTGRKSVGDCGDSLETHKEVSHGGRLPARKWHGRLKACSVRSELGRVRGGRRVSMESFLTAEPHSAWPEVRRSLRAAKERRAGKRAG